MSEWEGDNEAESMGRQKLDRPIVFLAMAAYVVVSPSLEQV